MRIPPILTIRRIAKMSDQYYELDVAAFAGELLSRWRILVGLLLFALALSAIYLAITPPVYRAEAFVAPPTAAQIRSLEHARAATGKINQNDIYQRYKRNIMSRHIQAAFLQSFFAETAGSSPTLEFISTSADGFSRRTRDYLMMETRWRVVRETETKTAPAAKGFSFAQEEIVIRVDADRTASRQQLLITVDWQNEQFVKDILDGLVKFTERQTTAELTAEAREQIQSRISNIEEVIEYKRNLYMNDREGQLAALEEALSIAENIGAVQPIDPLSRNVIVTINPPATVYKKPEETEKHPVHFIDTLTYLPLYQISTIGKRSNSEISSQPPPLYARGSEVLQAEIVALKSRTNHDQFIPDLGRLMEEMSWLRNIKIRARETESITPLTGAHVHAKTISPRPLIVLGSATGITLAIFLMIVAISLLATKRRI